MKRESLISSIPSHHFQCRSGMLDLSSGTYFHVVLMDYRRVPITEWNL